MCWTFDTRKEAEEFETRKLQQQAEAHIHPTTQKLKDFLAEWIVRKQDKGRSAKTLYDYQGAC